MCSHEFNPNPRTKREKGKKFFKKHVISALESIKSHLLSQCIVPPVKDKVIRTQRVLLLQGSFHIRNYVGCLAEGICHSASLHLLHKQSSTLVEKHLWVSLGVCFFTTSECLYLYNVAGTLSLVLSEIILRLPPTCHDQSSTLPKHPQGVRHYKWILLYIHIYTYLPSRILAEKIGAS